MRGRKHNHPILTDLYISPENTEKSNNLNLTKCSGDFVRKSRRVETKFHPFCLLPVFGLFLARLFVSLFACLFSRNNYNTKLGFMRNVTRCLKSFVAHTQYSTK